MAVMAGRSASVAGLISAADMGRKIKAFARLLEEASTVSTTLLRAQRSNPEMHPRRDSGLLRFARNDGG
jgi:hypothetical protein